MRTLTFTLGGTFLFILLSSSLGKVFTDEELKVELLKKVLMKLSDEEEKKSLDEEKRIYGGVELPEGEQKGLVYFEGTMPTRTLLGLVITSEKLYCAGTLVNARWVLTAASCFVNSKYGSKAVKPRNWEVRVGDVRRKGGWFHNFVGWDKIKGEEIIIKKGYSPKTNHTHNIALLKLETEVPAEDPNIAPVTLPVQGEHHYPTEGNTCVVLGWGCVRAGGDIVDVARKVDLMVLSEQRCRTLFPRVSMDTRICAEGLGEGKGVCNGDIGGPLMCKRHNQWYQAGVVSFSSEIEPENFPTVFTRVSSYRNWIDYNTEE